MKTMRKILCLLTVLCLLGAAVACGGGQQAAPGYRVTVVDALGNPYTEGVVVQFMQNGAAAGMQVVGADGTAVKDLPDGDYTVELQFTSDTTQYYYDKTDLTLSADKKELTVTLAMLPDSKETTLTVGTKTLKSYGVGVGCTYLTLAKGERNYYLFTPAVAGTYEFSVDDATATIGYYGAPHFVQDHHAGNEVKDGKFDMSIKADMIGSGDTGTTVIVLGVDAGDKENVTLSIQRTGEPQWDVSDEPWTTYEATVELKEYTLPDGASLKDFDLKADSYNLVLDDNGWYHLDSKDGPLVLMRLGEKSAYLDDFKTICEKSRVGKYFYDENGDFVKKESYNECLLEYIEVMDEKKGVYPLTEDLKYIIQQRGDHYGWFDADGKQYLFVDQNGDKIPGINEEISWLFPCCYIG